MTDAVKDTSYAGDVDPASTVISPQEKSPTENEVTPGFGVEQFGVGALGVDTVQFGTETPYRKTPPTNVGSVAEAAATSTPPTAAGVAQTDADDAAVPVNTVAPTISGVTTTGQTLTCAPGTFVPAASSVAYQWYRVNASTGAAAAISGATASTRVLAGADTGSKLFCRVTGKDSAGRAGASVDTAQTAVIA